MTKGIATAGGGAGGRPRGRAESADVVVAVVVVAVVAVVPEGVERPDPIGPGAIIGEADAAPSSSWRGATSWTYSLSSSSMSTSSENGFELSANGLETRPPPARRPAASLLRGVLSRLEDAAPSPLAPPAVLAESLAAQHSSTVDVDGDLLFNFALAFAYTSGGSLPLLIAVKVKGARGGRMEGLSFMHHSRPKTCLPPSYMRGILLWASNVA